MRPSSSLVLRRSLALSALSLALLLIAGCEDCGGTGVESPDAGRVGGGEGASCEDNGDCLSGHCQGGACVLGTVDDDDAGTVPPGDGGDSTPIGVLSVLPSTTVEFGAQLLGYPVTVDVTLANVGDGAMTILAVLLDTDTDEFTAAPTGTMNVQLAPGDNTVVRVTHTPQDGTPDAAELKILHDGQDNITTLSLFAEFKGDAELSLSEDLAVITPSADEVNFGEVDSGLTGTTTLWVRNTGSADSILTLSDLTITPANQGFEIVNDVELPLAIGAWSTALCPTENVSACPPFASACEDMICVDDDGAPLNAVPLDLSFTSGTLPSQATLTLEHDELGAVTQTDVLLLGLPTQPDVLVTPDTAVFPPTLVGAPTPTEVVLSVENVGAGPLFITKVVEPTSTTAFTFEYSRPVPHVDGDPPLRIDSGATPLDVTVTFTPEDAGSFTAVLTLHTNDGDSLSLPITLSGTGVVCQANAHVDDLGACVCDDGHIACGDECKLAGATACGAGCVDCTAVTGIGAGTNASCSIGGGCEYTCATAYYDVDNGSDGIPGGNNWNGCEYLCPRNPAWDSEQCNGVDDDCDNVVDEGLAADVSEGASNNNIISRASTVSGFSQVDATLTPAPVTLSRTLYPVNDSDWFKVTVNEGDSGAAPCLSDLPCLETGQERYKTVFAVEDPGTESYTLEVFAPSYPNYDSTTGTGTTLSGKTVTHNWTRESDLFECVLCGLGNYCYPGGYGCAFDDKHVYYVRVKPAVSGSFSCIEYSLSVTAYSLP